MIVASKLTDGNITLNTNVLESKQLCRVETTMYDRLFLFRLKEPKTKNNNLNVTTFGIQFRAN